MKKFTFLITFLFFSGCLITSCKKERQPVENLPGVQNLEIRLNTSYLAVSKIDSALLIWEVAGKTQRQSFSLSGDTLRLSIQQFQSGGGRMTLQLYTQVKQRELKLQFEKRWELELSHRNAVAVQGPAGVNDPGWMPRVILQEKEWTGLTAVVGLRPTDPYFSIRNISSRWPLIGLSRGFYKKPGGQLVAEKVWNNDGSDRSDFEDRTFFSNLSAQVGTEEWSWINIDLDIFSHTESMSFSLSFACPR